MIAPSQSDRVIEPLKNYVIFYDEVHQSELQFFLHLFISNVLDFYRLHPIQVTLNAIKIIIIFIICYWFAVIKLEISLFRSLFILKKYLYKKGWWYFSPRPKYKFGPTLPSSIHNRKIYLFFVSFDLSWGFNYN